MQASTCQENSISISQWVAVLIVFIPTFSSVASGDGGLGKLRGQRDAALVHDTRPQFARMGTNMQCKV